ncbi:DoxX family protein [Mesorhizobium sp. 1M-11]|uniref:DoxX family protein n=1 Tax=Mesorhizobium sp. 1M-11 TaxID=1529006 RepID=UPI0006C767D0|nr:DoxX family protein [Mesorhizobium sp. 1M-11]
MDLDRYSPQMLSVMRIVCGLAYLYCSLPALMQPPNLDHPTHMLLYWVSRWVQILAGSLIVVGLFTRLAALFLSINFFVMYPYWYQPGLNWPSVEATGFTLASVVCMYLVTAGAGRWSLDAVRTSLRDNLARR